MFKNKIEYVEDDTKPINFLFRLRVPSLFIGLILGVLLSFVTSSFEEVLSKNIQVAFFIPFIVYLADSVGTQTQSIYVRDLKTGKANFKKYLIKESALGFIFGIVFALITIPIVLLWFKSVTLASVVAISLFATISTAPLIALVITEILQIEHTDPAVGAGPISTVVQDTISVLLYGLIASAIIL